MDIHFNAFISYRHHPDDIRVAMEVHRALERYHVPRGLKKKLNVRGPMRLFRDKEELPITSNLNDDIGDALRNSDFLIVICSVHTKESIWVQREIELFLKSHDRHHVLTVLASGEPYDVIPEILLYDDRVDPITGETIRELVEPLSCDWRIGKKKAKREELPRLAAPLLGCAYDELRQRQKQYRMRRLVTLISLAMAAILGFSIYVLRNSMIIQQKNVEIQAQNDQIQAQNVEIQAQNVEIQANLDASLRNQSKHLATASQERLTEGDRLLAIALAEAALPNEENIRPYVAEAELALTNALGIYQENISTVAVGTVSPGNRAIINKFWTDPDGKFLYLYDSRHYVTVWDTHTMEKLSTWDHSAEAVDDLIPTHDGLALVKYHSDSADALRCMQTDGTVLWQEENCTDVKVTEDANIVVMVKKMGTGDYDLLFLDLHTGKQLKDPVDLNVFSGLMLPWQMYPYDLREGMPIIVEYSSYPDTQFAMFDWDTGEYRELPVELSDYTKALITSDGKLIAMTSAWSNTMTGVFDDNRVNSTMRRQVACYDLTKGTRLWQTEVTSATSSNGMLAEIPGGGRILCQSGPVFQVLDLATGETLNRCEAGSSVVTVSMGEKYAQAILEDGYICNYWYDENYCYEDKSLQSGVYQAYIRDGYFSLQRMDNHVTIYRKMAPPTLWDHDYTYAISVADQDIHGDQWLIRSGSDLYLFDLQTHEIRWAASTPMRELLGFTKDGSQIRFLDSKGYLYILDSVTCELVSDPTPISQQTVEDSYLKDETLYFITSGYTEDWEAFAQVNAMPMGGESVAYPLPAMNAEDKNCRYTVVGQYGQYLYLWESTQSQLWQLDQNSGDLKLLAEEVERCPVMQTSADGTYTVFTAEDQVLVLGAQMKTIAMEEDALAGSLYFYENELLVLCDNGFLYRYNMDGELLSRTELRVSETFSRDLLDPNKATPAKINWQLTADGRLIVSTFATGNVINCETWKVAAEVPGYYFYREADNSFVCNGQSGICGYNAYTLEELLQLAAEQLGNFSLTDQQKNAYGIE